MELVTFVFSAITVILLALTSYSIIQMREIGKDRDFWKSSSDKFNSMWEIEKDNNKSLNEYIDDSLKSVKDHVDKLEKAESDYRQSLIEFNENLIVLANQLEGKISELLDEGDFSIERKNEVKGEVIKDYNEASECVKKVTKAQENYEKELDKE